MTPDEAEALREQYAERRREWAAEIGRPHPPRRTSKIKPEPGALPLIDSEEG